MEISQNSLKPKDKQELVNLIDQEMALKGIDCDLNFIDTSLITDMSELFMRSHFNGDISRWNVSNVTNMYGMFSNSKFNGDISKWDTSKVEHMSYMFISSLFNGDISGWNTSSIRGMSYMFYNSKFNQDISHWQVSNVISMYSMFANSKFSQSIEIWNPVSLKDDVIENIYENCPAPKPSWLIEGKEKRNWYLSARIEKEFLNNKLTNQESVASKKEIFKL